MVHIEKSFSTRTYDYTKIKSIYQELFLNNLTAKLQDQIGQNEKLHQVKGNEGIYEVNC